MSKITKSQKKFLKSAYKKNSIEELSKKLGLSQEEILSYIKKSGKDVEKIVVAAGEKKVKSLREIFRMLKESKWLVLGLFVLVAALYFNSLKGQFVVDDILGFRDNPQVRDLAGSFGSMRVQAIVYALSYKFFGLNPTPLHAVSVFYHLLNSLLVFVLGTLLFGKRRGSLAALLFAAFPVNTEAVSWISASNYSLEATAFLVMAIFYILYKNSLKKMYLIGSVIAYLFAMFFVRSNFVISFVPLIFLIDRFFIEKKSFGSSLKNIAFLIPLTVVNFLYKYTQYNNRVLYLSGSSEANVATAMPYFLRFPYTLYSNIKLMVFPDSLSVFHEGDAISDTGFLFMWLFTVVFFGTAFFLRNTKPQVAGLILFIPAALLLTFSPVLISSYYAERYMYLAAIGFCLLLATLFMMLEEKLKVKHASVIITVFVLGLYSFRVVTRNVEWSTPEKLWISTVREVPNSPRAHKVLADYYVENMDFEKAAQESEIALKLRDGDYPGARNNLGLSYLRLGMAERAEEHFLENIKTYPDMWQSYFNMSEIEVNRNNLKGAVYYLEKVLELNPENEKARFILGKIREDTGL
ncbi:hypothetical protein A2380_02770 [candidate division WWE3 bacterium RIFOXYB1_FULL_43_24]|uniref:Uncharacterized protein n=2 Tax=Katanobacteria TaxID=422282 RepID=A0A0G0YMK3_UNCKA|nr:MAG: hypothetical protein UU92_C0007G0060 [candidate division WWE3 bacterium GW2011_GWA1_42_12]KKS34737.1 MAG: hypothetical protein UU97_C0007G0027 [candidate division WWE3 bacterium GW2011_GWD1_42_14]KKS37844.1 MAG: hypothetical protein UV00_C0011G0027 [candidate division WWE3 bacterium GW2011_GWF1_42_14]KKS40210.1 MAG: hypothetical protein UV03_C0010G0027 [candidate division WWE3 bacterium GW2011_GWE1_42_16]KKS66181.1 MAG: hypothetical protein UV35_C0023G0009 [candidate division WWE3 bacte